MAQEVDLHVHSTFSDGQFSPEELVKKSKKLEIKTLAITDHGTLGHIPEALYWGEELGVRVIPGAEIKVGYGKLSFHMLILDFDPENDSLVKRINQCGFCVNKLDQFKGKMRNLQLDFSRREAIAKINGKLPGSLDIAEMVFLRNAEKLMEEGIESPERFVAEYMLPGKSAYVPQTKIPAEELIDLVHGAGGKTFFAHPGATLGWKSQITVRMLFDRLYRIGLDGIEIFHPENNDYFIKLLKKLCDYYGFLESAGSDYHGESTPNYKLGGWSRKGFSPDFSWLKK